MQIAGDACVVVSSCIPNHCQRFAVKRLQSGSRHGFNVDEGMLVCVVLLCSFLGLLCCYATSLGYYFATSHNPSKAASGLGLGVLAGYASYLPSHLPLSLSPLAFALLLMWATKTTAGGGLYAHATNADLGQVLLPRLAAKAATGVDL
ncbi:hypothetical protein U1Q18_030519 [Sarracenia purpurea var. burkii]